MRVSTLLLFALVVVAVLLGSTATACPPAQLFAPQQQAGYCPPQQVFQAPQVVYQQPQVILQQPQYVPRQQQVFRQAPVYVACRRT